MAPKSSRRDPGEPADVRASLAAVETRAKALQDACNALAWGLDSGESLDALLDSAAFLADHVGLYAYTQTDPTLWLLIDHRGNPSPDTRTSYRCGEGLIGRAANGSVEPLLVGAETRVLALPVNTEDGTVAVLSLERNEGSGFSPEDLAAARALANLVGQVFQTGCYRREIKRLLAERSSVYRLARTISEVDSVQHLLDLAVPSLAHLLSARAGLIYLLSSSESGTGTWSAHGVGPELEGRIDAVLDCWMNTITRAPDGPVIVNQPDLTPFGSLTKSHESPSSLLLIGMKVAGRLIGAAGFERVVPTDGPYTSGDADLLAGLIGLLATAVENVRLRAYDISAFRELSQFPATALTIEEICDGILEKIARRFPCLGCHLASVDPANEKLQLRASRGLPWPNQADLSWLAPQQLGRFPARRPGVWVLDRSQHASDLPWPAAEAATLAVSSMQVEGSYLGAILLLFGPDQELSGQHQLLLASLASQAGLVIRFAHLLKTSQELLVQEERSRIAREIHDGVAQNLALLLLKMEVISRLADSNPRRVKVELEKVQSILESSVYELRRAIYALRSPDLAKLGLGPALQRLAREFAEQTNMEVALDLPSSLPLPPQLQSAVFSVVQERLDVIAKEGTATRVALSVQIEDGRLLVSVVDDGRRFRPAGKDNRALPAWHTHLDDRVGPLGGQTRFSVQAPEARLEIAIPLQGQHRPQERGRGEGGGDPLR